MSNSIYNISDWQATVFKKHDIVKYNNLYYYALDAHTGVDFDYDERKGLWGGNTLNSQGELKPHFIWKPSYSTSLTVEPRIKVLRFGDAYEQRMPDGINTLLLKFEMLFNQRDIHEYTAIMHFLVTRGGITSFLYTPPAPFIDKKLFICRSWDGSPESFNNYNIKATFEEVVN